MLKQVIISMRPRQWSKNLFIFLPLIFGKKLFVFPVNLKAVFVFFLFSLVSGVIYLINDMLDIEKDRAHPIKSKRPLASGEISRQQAQITVFILGIISILFSFVLNTYFGLIMVGYLVFNLVYTKVLKEVVIIDVFCIGVFFLLRIIGGSVIAGVEMSYWIIFMVILLALFLGFTKRRQELKIFEKNAVSRRPVLAKYTAYFIDQMIAVITSSIVVVYMLYTVDARTVNFFGTRNLIYSIPFVYYGIFRYLYLVHKQGEGEDPTQVLISDSKLQLDLALWIIVCVAVIYFGL